MKKLTFEEEQIVLVHLESKSELMLKQINAIDSDLAKYILKRDYDELISIIEKIK